MTKRLQRHHRRTCISVLLTVALMVFALGAFAQTSPVSVSFSVTGDPAPGATVTVTATVTTNDGSTVQGVSWSQTGGVEAALTGTSTNTITVALPGRKAFKDELIHVLETPPHAELPGEHPTPSPYYGGLQSDRFGVAGASHLSIEEAGEIGLNLAVTTSSGTYNVGTAVHASLPWKNSPGIRNVPVNVPVLIHGKEQASYDWTLNKPSGSSATLNDATTQSPDFTPDVTGAYTLTVTDIEAGTAKEVKIFAGTWKGVIVGEDADGRPMVDSDCTVCHQPDTLIDQFSVWRQSGHAEILTQNVNNPNGHYSTNCVGCHTVGYNLDAVNNGIDEAADWDGVLQSGYLTHGDEDNWANLLATYPESARMMNIQCENCHGPQAGQAHRDSTEARTSLSSDVCGSCHGEPARHGRFQQWQLSAHANYQVARDEGMSGSCSVCHTGNGFLAWAEQGFTGSVDVTWSEDEIHPQTCATCHDPHDVGTTSGGPETNAKVRVYGDTPMLASGYKAENVGSAALCMTCHNGRRGLRDDDNFNLGDAARAPHRGPQTDILMGRNLFFVETGKAGYHSKIEDACVTCHMEKTSPPAELSYNLGGTNHTFFANDDICANCHTEIDAEGVQATVEAKLETLKEEIETALMTSMKGILRAGNKIDFEGTVVESADAITNVEFTESHGRQAVNVSLSTGDEIEHARLSSTNVVPPAGSPRGFFEVADPNIAKAGWNYLSIHADGSHGVHNTSFVNAALDVSAYAMETYVATANTGNPELGGGLGNGAGAVACTTPYVYWAEIAGHIPGDSNSQWRTDLVARNLSGGDATLKFYLHENTGRLEGDGLVDGSSQMVFEDIVALMGGTNNLGSLEICSDRPLLVMARIFSQSEDGTFGQSFDGKVADLGYGAGETFSLIGMRQQSGAFRTNLSVTNGGTTDAEVAITLYDASGNEVTSYTLTVPAGQVVQDTSPFANRGNAPDVGWGFATVTVLQGSNVQASASMVDMKTNDPTTIPAKR